MAHRILSVDLGASSVKVAHFEAGFRKAALLDVERFDRGVVAAASREAELASGIEALVRWLGDHPVPSEELAIGLPGDVLTFRTLDLPFSDPRKIESVIGFELESEVLTTIDQLVIDSIVVGPLGPQTRVLCGAAPRAVVEAVIAASAPLGLPVRLVAAAPLAYAALAGLPAIGAAEAAPANPPAGVLVVDVGYRQTTVCALRGARPELARSLPRGGRHFTEAIAAAFQLDEASAEQAKRDAGFLAHASLQPTNHGQQKMAECLAEAAKPLVRELRQTLAAHRASYGEGIGEIWTTGGGARLVGLPEHLATELGLPVRPLPWPEPERWAMPSASAREEVAVAVGIGVAAAGPAAQVNFRKGELAYRTDYSFLRDKALYFAAALAAVLGFAGLNTYASLHGLHREQEMLTQRLKRETLELFGSERTDAAAVSAELRGGPKGFGALPIPSVTAYDVLSDISSHVPPADKIRLDVLELDIKPKKIYLKATAETAQQVDDLADALKAIDCFEEIQKGKLSTVTGPSAASASSGSSAGSEPPKELKQFTLTINSTCP